MKLRNLLIAAVGLAMAAGAADAASAATVHHPRRVEVNHRLTHLNRSIRHDHRVGALSAYQAREMRERVHAIRVHERMDARHDRGHISRREQARLNHEETGVRHHLPA